MHYVDLGGSFPTRISLQNLASVQPLTSLVKFARSPRTDHYYIIITDPPGGGLQSTSEPPVTSEPVTSEPPDPGPRHGSGSGPWFQGGGEPRRGEEPVGRAAPADSRGGAEEPRGHEGRRQVAADRRSHRGCGRLQGGYRCRRFGDEYFCRHRSVSPLCLAAPRRTRPVLPFCLALRRL